MFTHRALRRAHTVPGSLVVALGGLLVPVSALYGVPSLEDPPKATHPTFRGGTLVALTVLRQGP